MHVAGYSRQADQQRRLKHEGMGLGEKFQAPRHGPRAAKHTFLDWQLLDTFVSSMSFPSQGEVPSCISQVVGFEIGMGVWQGFTHAHSAHAMSQSGGPLAQRWFSSVPFIFV